MGVTVREVLLFLRAMPVAMAAQEVRERPLPRVIERVRAMVGRVSVAEPDVAVRAAQRSCARWARWFGGLDSCLTRSLVAGALLAGRHEVVLHVGFRPTQVGAEAVDGHAWLEVDGEAVELTGLDRCHGEPYSSSLRLTM